MKVSTVDRRFCKSACFVLGMGLLICSALVGTVSAGGGGGGSSEVTYSSTTLYTNWVKIYGPYYEVIIKNPQTTIYRMTVKLPETPKTTDMDYLGYTFGTYSEKMTDEQKSAIYNEILKANFPNDPSVNDPDYYRKIWEFHQEEVRIWGPRGF